MKNNGDKNKYCQVFPLLKVLCGSFYNWLQLTKFSILWWYNSCIISFVEQGSVTTFSNYLNLLSLYHYLILCVTQISPIASILGHAISKLWDTKCFRALYCNITHLKRSSQWNLLYFVLGHVYFMYWLITLSLTKNRISRRNVLRNQNVLRHFVVLHRLKFLVSLPADVNKSLIWMVSTLLI